MNKTLLLTGAMGLSLISHALTLDEALQVAFENSPAIHAARLDVRSAEADARAAVLWKNPELDFEAEGIGGDHSGLNETEYTAMISQQFPMFGKIDQRRAAAQKAVQVHEYDIAEAGLALAAQVRAAFAEALAQQEISAVRSQQEQLANELVEAAQARRAAGGASDLEVLQAELALDEVLMEKQCCFGDLDSAKKLLASLLGVSLEDVGVPEGDLYALEPSAVRAVEDTHPALQRIRAQEERLQADAAVARSQDVPDISLGAGVKYEDAENAQSFVVAASIPLSIRKKGRAEGAAALLRAEALHARHEQVRRELQQQLDRLVNEYHRAASEADQYKSQMLPKAEQAYALSRAGYEAGRYSWMELLTAQQNLAEIRIRYVEALLVAQQTLAALSQFNQGDPS